MSLKILIVEDEFLIALELESRLAEHGHEVVGIAASVETGLRLAEEHRPDVATVDLRLRYGGNGEELAAEILNRFGIRSIFVSGNLDAETRARLAQMRPYGFVGKPVSPHLLKAVIDAVADEGPGPMAPPTEST